MSLRKSTEQQRLQAAERAAESRFYACLDPIHTVREPDAFAQGGPPSFKPGGQLYSKLAQFILALRGRQVRPDNASANERAAYSVLLQRAVDAGELTDADVEPWAAFLNASLGDKFARCRCGFAV